MTEPDANTHLDALRRQMEEISRPRVTPANPIQRVLGLTKDPDDAKQASLLCQRQGIDGAECCFIPVGADVSIDFFLREVLPGIVARQVDIVAIAVGVFRSRIANDVFSHLLSLPGEIAVVAPQTKLAEIAVVAQLQHQIHQRRTRFLRAD